MPKKADPSLQAPQIPISSIYIPDDVPNRRPGWEAGLKPLVESLEIRGQITPISVVAMSSPGPNGEGFRLVDGFRRVMAHKKLDKKTIKAIAMPVKTTQKEEFCARVAANEVRLGNTPLEQAALAHYAVKELGIPQHEYAKSVGKTASWVSQRLTALKQPSEVQEALEDGEITFTHVRALSRVKDEDEQKKLLKKAKKYGATDFEDVVEEHLDGAPEKKPAKQKDVLNVGHEFRVRTAKEISEILARGTKAYHTLKEKDTHAAEKISEFMRGVSWAVGYKGVKPPKL